MKLIDKLNRTYIIYSFGSMMIAGLFIYLSISYVVKRELDEKLNDIMIHTVNQLTEDTEIQYLAPFIEIKKNQEKAEKTVYSDTVIFNQREQELEIYRQLTQTKTIGNQPFKIIVRESILESEDLIITLVIIVILTLLGLTGCLVIANRKVARSVWSPFYANLQIIKQYSVRNYLEVQLNKTNILEFDELNQVITQLTRKIATDFLNLKQFSEDASHEIQTPLAIISAKLEAIISEGDLNEKHLETIRSIFSSVHRLSKLNQGLLLLTKIENNQFPDSKDISFNTLITVKLHDFQELMELKAITVEIKEENELLIQTNPVLADIFINNLLSNSLNHNISGGLIRIKIKRDELEICNNGQTPILNPGKLFARFYKEDKSSKSVGLGLAIVNKICEDQGWLINYRFENYMHCFHIKFSL